VPYLLAIGQRSRRRNEMFVDMRLADLETERKREQLARSYSRANRRRREQPRLEVTEEGTWHTMLLARFMLLNR
jgi:hypothetical protein